MSPEKLLEDLETLKSDKALLGQSLTSAVKLTFVEKFPQGFDRPCNENDFTKSKTANESQTAYIKLIIENLCDSSNQIVDKNTSHPIAHSELIASILVMCGENATLQPWNNEIIIQNCHIVLSNILKILNCCDIPDLISKNPKSSLITDVLNLLSSKLLPSTWKYFPATVACFKWFLQMVKQPILSPHLQSVLPPSLLLVDDFINENKIDGVKCLNHIIKNMAAAELQLYGHGDVIFSALLPIIRMREASLLIDSIPLMLLLTTKLEFHFRNENETKWSRFDTILEILLENMELEQLIELRSCYITHLALVIDSLKLKIVRWSRRLLRIFEEYIHEAAKFNDKKSMSSCIKAVEKYLKFSEDVIPLHNKKLLFMLSVALIFSNNSSTEIQMETKEKIIGCMKTILKSMSKASYEEFKLALQENYESKKQYWKFYQQFKNIIEEHDNMYNINKSNTNYEVSYISFKSIIPAFKIVL